MAERRVRQTPIERLVDHFITAPLADTELTLVIVQAIVKSRRNASGKPDKPKSRDGGRPLAARAPRDVATGE